MGEFDRICYTTETFDRGIWWTDVAQINSDMSNAPVRLSCKFQKEQESVDPTFPAVANINSCAILLSNVQPSALFTGLFCLSDVLKNVEIVGMTDLWKLINAARFEDGTRT